MDKNDSSAVTEQYHPYTTFDPKASTPETSAQGIFPDVFKQLSFLMNFTFDISLPPDRKYGVLTEDGVSFNGMLGMLQRKEVRED